MGAVYLAQQSRPRRSVAVKVLMPGLFLETKVRKEFLLRFRREAKNPSTGPVNFTALNPYAIAPTLPTTWQG